MNSQLLPSVAARELQSSNLAIHAEALGTRATMLALQGLDVAISENRGTSKAEEPDLDAYACDRNPITGY